MGRVTSNNGPEVVLNPCLEFVSELQVVHGPQGQMQIVGRSRSILPYEDLLEPTKVSVLAVEIVWFRSMHEGDRKPLEQMVSRALDAMDKERARRRSGLVIANTLPEGPNAPRR